jgi:hypothetical protein
MVEQHRLWRGDTRRAPAVLTRLQAAKDSDWIATIDRGCAVLLDAILATVRHRPDAAVRTERLDSLMRTGPTINFVATYGNLVVARLHEAQGHPAEALTAVQRLWYGDFPIFWSTYLRDRGRIAAFAGDTAGAIAAYRGYLELRYDPEPGLRPQVESVQAELARLEARH